VFRANLLSSDWLAKDAVVKEMQKDSNPFCFAPSGCANCDMMKTMNFAHYDCFQRAQKEVPEFSFSHLPRLARMAQPLWTWKVACKLTANLISPLRAGLPDNLSTGTSLGKLVAEVRAILPLELQGYVCDETTGLFQALTKSSLTAYNFARHLDCINDGLRAYCPLPDAKSLTGIGANVATVLGEPCLEQVGVANETQSFDVQIEFDREKAVYGFQVSIGMYGVVGLRVLYLDNTTSAWLGLGGRRWTVTLKGGDLTRLRVLFDVSELICVHILSLDSPLTLDRASRY
jgi:hypothetical protein